MIPNVKKKSTSFGMVLSRVLFTFVTLDCPSEFGEIDVLRFFEVGKL